MAVARRFLCAMILVVCLGVAFVARVVEHSTLGALACLRRALAEIQRELTQRRSAFTIHRDVCSLPVLNSLYSKFKQIRFISFVDKLNLQR